MTDRILQTSALGVTFAGNLDAPGPDESVYDQAIFLSGWICVPERDPATWWVRAFLDDSWCGGNAQFLSPF